MGVKQLWTLLSPAAYSSKPQNLINKVVAVDISIWLHQFVLGITVKDEFQDLDDRDRSELEMFKSSVSLHRLYLIALFHRICKLLYFQAKPVFVYDGQTPLIKRKTVQKRAKERRKQTRNITKVAKKLIKRQLKEGTLSTPKVKRKRVEKKTPTKSLVNATPIAAEYYDERNWEFEKDEQNSLEDDEAENELNSSLRSNSTNNTSMTSESSFEQSLLNILGSDEEQEEPNNNTNHSFQEKEEEAGGFLEEEDEKVDKHSPTVIDIPFKNPSIEFTPPKPKPTLASPQQQHFLTQLSSTQILDFVRQSDASLDPHVFQQLPDEIKMEIFASVKQKMSERWKRRDDIQQLKDQSPDNFSNSQLKEFISSAKTTRMIKSLYNNSSDTIQSTVITTPPKENKSVSIDVTKFIKPSQANASKLVEVKDEEDEFESENLEDRRRQIIEQQETLELEKMYTKVVHVDLAKEISVLTSQDPSQHSNNTIQDDELFPEEIFQVHEENTEHVHHHNRPVPKIEEVSPIAPKSLSVDFLEDSSEDEFEMEILTPKEDKGKGRVAIGPQLRTQQELEEFEKRRDQVEQKSTTPIEIDEDDDNENIQPNEEEADLLFDLETIEAINRSTAEVVAQVKTDAVPSIENAPPSKPLFSKSVENDEDDNFDPNEGYAEPEPAVPIQKKASENRRRAIEQYDKDMEKVLEDDSLLELAEAQTISDELIEDSKQLLQAFGIPYVESPYEADSQCGYLSQHKLVDAVITEDSDVFLFGAKLVFKRIFSATDAEEYSMEEIGRVMGLNRIQLVALAMLLGSDYTDGVHNVGIVTGMQVIDAFHIAIDAEVWEKHTPKQQVNHIIEKLKEFAKWVKEPLTKKPMRSSSQTENSQLEEFKLKYYKVKQNFILPPDFPDPKIAEAYLDAQNIDSSLEVFTWADINQDELANFAAQRMGWDRERLMKYLQPVLEIVDKRRRGETLDKWLVAKGAQVGVVKSERLSSAIESLRKKQEKAKIQKAAKKTKKNSKKSKS